jgi:molybdate transport system substrate-binding protein
MVKGSMKKLAVGLTAAAAIGSAPAKAQAVLQIASETAFSLPASDFGFSFEAFYFFTQNIDYSFGLSVSTGSDLEAGIISGAYHFDLLFSATPEIPEDLARRYPHLVVGRPFTVAIDSLAYWSPSLNVSAGLPFPLTTQIGIPDPSFDNFGAAATEVLASWPWRIAPWSIPNNLVSIWGDVGVSLAAIEGGYIPSGFVARSQVCQYTPATGAYSLPNGGYYHDYEPFGRHPYNPGLVTVTAIRIANSRTAQQEQALANYVAFLTGTKDTFGNTNIDADGFTFGQDAIRAYCLKIPGPFSWETADRDH